MLEDDYKKKEQEFAKAVTKAAKGTDSEILKKVVKKVNKNENPKQRQICRMVDMLFHEMLEMYESGDKTLSEAIDDFVGAARELK